MLLLIYFFNIINKRKMNPPKPQWLKELAIKNFKRDIEMKNRRDKANPKDHDIVYL